MMRAFVALALPGSVTDRLALLSQMLPLPRRVPPGNMHLTLAFLGEVPAQVLEDVHMALATTRAEPFALSLQGTGLFGGAKPRAAWAGVAPNPALSRLQSRVEQAARAAGAPIEKRRFVPHVTLGRFAPPEPALRARLEQAIVGSAGFATDAFAVDSFALFRSDLGPKGAHYSVLAEYPLTTA